MNINQCSNLNFNAKMSTRTFTFRVPGKDGTTVLTDVVEIPQRLKKDIINISYKVIKKGKVLEEKSYQNKKGFEDERFGSICEKIQQKVKEGYEFIGEFFSAQYKNPTL